MPFDEELQFQENFTTKKFFIAHFELVLCICRNLRYGNNPVLLAVG
jgi:hypothetical protein